MVIDPRTKTKKIEMIRVKGDEEKREKAAGLR